jgi:hypothetical protein
LKSRRASSSPVSEDLDHRGVPRKRKSGLSAQEFADYYEHNHVPLVLSKAFMPMVYSASASSVGTPSTSKMTRSALIA